MEDQKKFARTEVEFAVTRKSLVGKACAARRLRAGWLRFTGVDPAQAGPVP
jgi:hypothetical protein